MYKVKDVSISNVGRQLSDGVNFVTKGYALCFVYLGYACTGICTPTALDSTVPAVALSFSSIRTYHCDGDI